ncbi:MAG: 2-phosphosulfolactate phosphatase [Trueperaceae bacterium]
MLRLEIDFLPVPRELDVAIVIDVLRMTTTAGVLFARGLSELSVLADIAEAHTAAAPSGALLLGEREGVKLPGFDGGNSPLEYMEMDLTGRSAVLCTSNGSKAVVTAAGARQLLLGSIVNAGVVAERAVELAEESVTLICAGTAGQVSMDDALGAYAIAKEIVRIDTATNASDGTRIVLAYGAQITDMRVALHEASHAALLRKIGFGADVDFAAHLNYLDIVPIRTSGRDHVFRATAS